MATQFKNTNLNFHIKFKPNERAITWYNNFMLGLQLPSNLNADSELALDEQGFAVLQMHEFMFVYGTKISETGYTRPCIEFDSVEVEVYE